MLDLRCLRGHSSEGKQEECMQVYQSDDKKEFEIFCLTPGLQVEEIRSLSNSPKNQMRLVLLAGLCKTGCHRFHCNAAFDCLLNMEGGPGGRRGGDRGLNIAVKRHTVRLKVLLLKL